MPVFGGGRRAAKVAQLPEWVGRYFLEGELPATGTPDHFDWGQVCFFSGRDSERNLWSHHEAELLSVWIAKHPGSRPWAWWRFSAPEGRRQVAGGPIERGAYHDQVDGEGLPLALGEFSHGVVGFESQAACLKRLNLLGEAEAARVTRSQYRPRTFKALAEDEPGA